MIKKDISSKKYKSKISIQISSTDSLFNFKVKFSPQTACNKKLQDNNCNEMERHNDEKGGSERHNDEKEGSVGPYE